MGKMKGRKGKGKLSCEAASAGRRFSSGRIAGSGARGGARDGAICYCSGVFLMRFLMRVRRCPFEETFLQMLL